MFRSGPVLAPRIRDMQALRCALVITSGKSSSSKPWLCRAPHAQASYHTDRSLGRATSCWGKPHQPGGSCLRVQVARLRTEGMPHRIRPTKMPTLGKQWALGRSRPCTPAPVAAGAWPGVGWELRCEGPLRRHPARRESTPDRRPIPRNPGAYARCFYIARSSSKPSLRSWRADSSWIRDAALGPTQTRPEFRSG